MGGEVADQQVKGRPLAVDDDPVAIEQHGGGAGHPGALSRVTSVSP